MTKTEKIICSSLSLLTFIGAFLFFRLGYPYHIHYQEQCQLFQFTTEYFASVAGVPGGLADYISRFLVQFFYYADAGAFVLAALILAVWLLVFFILPKRTLVSFAASMLPALSIFVFLLDENALLGPVVSLVISLAFSLLVGKIRSGRYQFFIALLLIPVLYMICGPVAVVFALLSVRKEYLWANLIILAFALSCPFLFYIKGNYPLSRLFTGVHYYRYHNVISLWQWLSVLLVVVIHALSFVRLPQIGKKSVSIVALTIFLTVGAAATYACVNVADFKKEEMMAYDFMARYRMWNKILAMASKKNPDNPTTVSCLNLALAKSGKMADQMFDYFQNGPDGLFPAFQKECFSPVPTSEIYWHLGMTNACQRYVFEAQEAIPDFQKSGRLYCRLAETNHINGDTGVCEKYLKALDNTLFYSGWARGFRANADKFPDYQALKSFRKTSEDYLISESEMYSMLGLLYLQDKENDMAYDYLMAYTLLIKRLDLFMDCLKLKDFRIVPKHYQEAAILFLYEKQVSQDDIPSFIDPQIIRRFLSFVGDYSANMSIQQLEAKYSGTYWLYYYFRYKT